MSLYYSRWTIVIAWQLDLQLHVQSVSITTVVVSSNPAHGGLIVSASISNNHPRYWPVWFPHQELITLGRN